MLLLCLFIVWNDEDIILMIHEVATHFLVHELLFLNEPSFTCFLTHAQNLSLVQYEWVLIRRCIQLD